VLPLSFEDPADYDRVREADRVTIGLQDLAVGSPLSMALHHDDGSEESFAVSHTLNEEQIEWFRAGSALNTLQ
jgi:aconitate hydratase